MKTIHAAADRRSIVERIGRLQPDSRAQWGKFTAPRMVVHLTDALRMATGELACKPKQTPLRFAPLKQLAIYVLPFPKGLPTAPELLERVPSAWKGEVNALEGMLDRVGKRTATDAWPLHPVFGTLSPRAWGVLVYRHCDHHLRQFGV
ncbi:MAG: hypothetical protein JWL61_4728 [Gemmatimonadetes bacterium]|nr:hypothetical protein [Gemmatimonadota bacterium]